MWGFLLKEIFERMYTALGPQEWWPGDSPLEICIGAILTQNTNWQNVEKAIANLKKAGLLELPSLIECPEPFLAELIRPAGYYRIKARRIKNFLRFLKEKYHGSLEELFSLPLSQAREALLSVSGIGPETADSILLYAGGKPTFVVDAYTRRIFWRHQWIDKDLSYEEVRELFMRHLPHDPQLFNEYHALLVAVGKNFCQTKKPLCSKCPLKDIKT